jgi:glucosamine 6-phosphate synthetase-like amidotransferase/phosphosugar isomerase protein
MLKEIFTTEGMATMKGNKVDQPRNLAKSVTVSD